MQKPWHVSNQTGPEARYQPKGDRLLGRRTANPSLAFIQRAAKVLGVSTVELLGNESTNGRSRPEAPSALALRFEQILQLPRKEQEFVILFLDTVLERAARY
jgi:transcriptional regulator with XRE-family HTH domain